MYVAPWSSDSQLPAYGGSQRIFAGHFIVRLQNIVKVLDRVIIAAHRMILNDVIKPDHFAVIAIGE